MSKIVSIHSFRPGTGKSTLTANLAVQLTLQRLRVGILDADIESPGIYQFFGLQKNEIHRIFAEHIDNHQQFAEMAHNITDLIGNRGRLYIIPTKFLPGEIAQWIYEDDEIKCLSDGFQSIIRNLQLDFLLIDSPAGFTEESLLFLANSETLLLVLCAENEDFQGTAVTVDLARKLEVPQINLVVNQIPENVDFLHLKQQLETTYQAPVIGMIPFSEDIGLMAQGKFFSWHYPEHSAILGIKAIALEILRLSSQPKQMTEELLQQLRKEGLEWKIWE
ncbi:MinD/ParA family protein [Floridanema aerugineum]|uniref:MinD/ParA family protein n=1 Tax=Floridaenema aerugineum BLCC-F46 TaxID=3153654 RepID=A0ABV4X1T0_9CYAN